MKRSVRIRSPANKHKIDVVKRFLTEYNKCVNYFIHSLWSEQRFNEWYLEKPLTNSAKKRFKLSSTAIQSAAALSTQIVKSQQEKSNRKITMPRFNKLTATLDNRFWQITEKKNTYEWLKIHAGFKIFIPFKHTIIWNKWIDKDFKLANSIQLTMINNKLFINFIFEKPTVPIKETGEVVGMDMGYVNLATCSNSQILGKNMNKLIETFDEQEKHTRQQIRNYSYSELKNFNFSNTKVLVIENLRFLKSRTRGMFSRKHNRRLSHWQYAKVTNWLKQRCEEEGVRLVKVSPYKTSQYCRICNNWDKRNRNGEIFKCVYCGHTNHADSNAAQNIKLLGLAGVYSLRSLKSRSCGGSIKRTSAKLTTVAFRVVKLG